MKTQISSLQRGHGREGIIGSSYEQRMAIAKRVFEENPNEIEISYKGDDFTLYFRESGSGKTKWYVGENLPTSIIKKIAPYDTKAINHPELVQYQFRLNYDMTIEIVTMRRTRITRQWKAGQTIEIPESEITIF